MKLKEIADFFNGEPIASQDYGSVGVMVIQPVNISDSGSIETAKPAYVSQFNPDLLLQPGDLVMIRVGNRAGRIGKFSGAYRAIPGPYVIVIRPKQGYENLWDSVLIHRDSLQGLSAGSPVPIISTEALAELEI